MLLIVTLFVLFNVTLETIDRLVAGKTVCPGAGTREIFLGLFVLSMISLNFINPLLQRYGAEARPFVMRLLPYFVAFPPSLAGRSIAAISQLHPAGFLLASGGLLLYLLFFSALLWRRFAAQYPAKSSAKLRRRPARLVRNHRKNRTGRRWPGSAVSAGGRGRSKRFRYLTRNGFAYLTTSDAAAAGAGLQFAVCRPSPDRLWQSSLGGNVFPGMMAYLILILMAPAYNVLPMRGRGIPNVLHRAAALPRCLSWKKPGASLDTDARNPRCPWPC